MAIQRGYGKQRRFDTEATPLRIVFISDDADYVGLTEPITDYVANFPQHTILLKLPLDGPHEVRARVRHLAAGSEHRILAAIRPQTAHTLGHRLLLAAEEAKQGDDPPSSTD